MRPITRTPIEIGLRIVCGVSVLLIICLSLLALDKVVTLLLGILVGAINTVLGSILICLARYKDQQIWPAFLIPLISLGVILSVLMWQWPLQAAYRLSRPYFDAFAAQFQEGQSLAKPRRVGLFKIQKAEVSNKGIVCLWTHPDSAGNTGFVQCKPDHVPFNLWSIVKLDDNWQFITED